MCFGGSKGNSTTPAQSAPVTSATPEFNAAGYDDEKSSETSMKKRRGKRSLRIKRDNYDTANTNSEASGLNIPTK